MSDAFRFETFVDVHSNIFNEYISSVIARSGKENEEYQALQDKIESLYGKYPAVLGVCDSEQAAELTKEECAALIQVMELKNQLVEMEMQSVYLRGCYDGVGYLKKADLKVVSALLSQFERKVVSEIWRMKLSLQAM